MCIRCRRSSSSSASGASHGRLGPSPSASRQTRPCTFRRVSEALQALLLGGLVLQELRLFTFCNVASHQHAYHLAGGSQASWQLEMYVGRS